LGRTSVFVTNPRFDLSTPAGRKNAETDLIWADHGFLRAMYQNFHWVTPEMARANQPSPAHIARYAQMGIKTIINLRGESPTGYFVLEQEACAANGVALVNAPMGSREAPPKARIHFAKEIFETIAYPALMHCKSGADRAGIMAVFYLHFKKGMPIAEAVNQLSLKYLHVKAGKTGMLDFFFAAYLADNVKRPMPFLQWVDEVYDPDALKAAFHSSWWANVLVDRILRRE
jgi:uncharacterized protein (TIGR01244 family)